MSNNEVILGQSQAVPEIFEPELLKNDFDVDTIVANAEKQMVAMDKILMIAIKSTNPSDWVDQSGKPYLRESGANKICRNFGLNITKITTDKKYSTDDLGHYYFYVLGATFSWRFGSIEAIGTTSSRDKFFGYKDGSFLPLSEIDETNLMKAAYANLYVNGVTRLLGLRNLSWEQIEKMGLDKSKVAKVEYKTQEQSSEDITAIRDELRNGLLRLTNEDEKSAAELLKKLTTFEGKDGKEVPGVDRVQNLTGKRLHYANEKVKKELKNKGMA